MSVTVEGLTFDNPTHARAFFKAMEIKDVRYLALHSHSRAKGDPCYLTRHGGIITPDKSKAKTWKTFRGILKAMRAGLFNAGYEVKAFRVEELAPKKV